MLTKPIDFAWGLEKMYVKKAKRKRKHWLYLDPESLSVFDLFVDAIFGNRIMEWPRK